MRYYQWPIAYSSPDKGKSPYMHMTAAKPPLVIPHRLISHLGHL